MGEIDLEILEQIRRYWATHREECDQPPKAVLLNPGNHSLIGWDEIFGLPALPDNRVEPMRCRLLCGVGRGGNPYVADSPEEAA